ncbi:MAG: tetratricopeptide repeat protein [Myxococcaceae bacterium]
MHAAAELPDYAFPDLANRLGLTVAELRRCLRAGLAPGARVTRGRISIPFQDLSLLRSVSRLMSARVPPHRVRRALQRLRTQIPEDRPLSAVALTTSAGHIVARDGEMAWETESKQLLLDFAAEPAAPAKWPKALALPPLRGRPELHADGHYERALALEDIDPRGARRAYEQVLVLDPHHADALLNLGRMLHAAGELTNAESLFRRAVAERPEDATAAFNLGVALEDQERLDDALAAYGRAIALNAACEDAHFNAARLYERRGDRKRALVHLKTYRQLLRDA